MPFKSENQRRYLWMHHPDVAKRWTQEHGSKIQRAAKKRLKKTGKNVARHK